MSVSSVIGYSCLFIFLFLLIAVHPGFIFLFFFSIIIVIIHKIKKRKKSKSSIVKTYPKDYVKQNPETQKMKTKTYPNDYVKQSIEIQKIETEKFSNELKSVENIPQIKTLPQFDEKKGNSAILYNCEQTFSENSESENSESENSESENSESENSESDIDVTPMENQKQHNIQKSFDRDYWNFHFDEHVESKKHKFLEAIGLCKKNNLGSKAKIRRLEMKIDKWNVENERDMDVLMPDYEYLLDSIEEFETR